MLNDHDKKKVCYLASDPRIHFDAPNGYGSHIRKTVRAFEDKDFDVVPLIAGDLRDIRRSRNAYRKAIQVTPRGLDGVRRALRDLNEIRDDVCSLSFYKRVVGQARVDFVYERMAPFRRVGYRLSRWLDAPLVLEINDPLYETFRFYKSSLRSYAFRIEQYLLEHAAGIVVGSRALARYYADRGRSLSSMKVIYPTADYAVFDRPPGVAAGPERDPLVVGFVGTMRPWHRADYLVEAFARVCAKRRNVILEMIGEGPESPRLVELTRKLGIAERVVFRGHVAPEAVPDLMQGHDICVIPNAMWYGSPTKLFEYGAMGKPVIGPRNTPVAEIIDDGVHGRLFEIGRIDELASALLELCDSPAAREDLGGALRAKLLGEITWDRNVDEIVELAMAGVTPRSERSRIA